MAIGLGELPVTACELGDCNHDGRITVDELVGAVIRLLAGCPGDS